MTSGGTEGASGSSDQCKRGQNGGQSSGGEGAGPPSGVSRSRSTDVILNQIQVSLVVNARGFENSVQSRFEPTIVCM